MNEDDCAALPELGLWVVADGMGGHAAGEVASRLVVDEMRGVGAASDPGDQRGRVLGRLASAHRRILAHAAGHHLPMMGATVAALMIHDDTLACVWAGDSRIYLLRDGRLTLMTRDHSEVGLMVERGLLTAAEARRSPRRHVVTRAVGIAMDPQPEIVSGRALPGDRMLLCSDGLTEHLADDEIEAMMADGKDAQATAGALVARTLDRGASDNVTVIVVDCVAAQGAADAGGAPAAAAAARRWD